MKDVDKINFFVGKELAGCDHNVENCKKEAIIDGKAADYV